MGTKASSTAKRSSTLRLLGTMLALVVAAVLAALCLVMAAPTQAHAAETPVFKTSENFQIYAGRSKGLVDEGDSYSYVFVLANDFRAFSSINSLVASVNSSDESVLQITRETLGSGQPYYSVNALKKGSVTVTMTDTYGNSWSALVNVAPYATVDADWAGWADYGSLFEYMHRLYNPNTGEHFYTADVSEVDSVVSAGWNYEGVGWTAPKASNSNTPVYRLYNPNPGPNGSGEHHYTMSAEEKEMLIAAGWKDEGIGWYSADASTGWVEGYSGGVLGNATISLYREYNPNEFNCNHNYTTSKDEHDSLVALGWKDEGTAWLGVTLVGG